MPMPHVNASVPVAGAVTVMSTGRFNGKSAGDSGDGNTTCCPQPSSDVHEQKCHGDPAAACASRVVPIAVHGDEPRSGSSIPPRRPVTPAAATATIKAVATNHDLSAIETSTQKVAQVTSGGDASVSRLAASSGGGRGPVQSTGPLTPSHTHVGVALLAGRTRISRRGGASARYRPLRPVEAVDVYGACVARSPADSGRLAGRTHGLRAPGDTKGGQGDERPREAKIVSGGWHDAVSATPVPAAGGSER